MVVSYNKFRLVYAMPYDTYNGVKIIKYFSDEYVEFPSEVSMEDAYKIISYVLSYCAVVNDNKFEFYSLNNIISAFNLFRKFLKVSKFDDKVIDSYDDTDLSYSGSNSKFKIMYPDKLDKNTRRDITIKTPLGFEFDERKKRPYEDVMSLYLLDKDINVDDFINDSDANINILEFLEKCLKQDWYNGFVSYEEFIAICDKYGIFCDKNLRIRIKKDRNKFVRSKYNYC